MTKADLEANIAPASLDGRRIIFCAGEKKRELENRTKTTKSRWNLLNYGIDWDLYNCPKIDLKRCKRRLFRNYGG